MAMVVVTLVLLNWWLLKIRSTDFAEPLRDSASVFVLVS